MKSSLWMKLDVSDDLIKKCEKSGNELERLKGDNPRVKREMCELDPTIWEKYENLRKAEVLKSGNLIVIREEYLKLQSQKDAILSKYDQAVSAKRCECEALMAPVHSDALKLIEDESAKLLTQYIFSTPMARPHPRNPQKELGPWKVNPETNTRTLAVTSNGAAILEGQRILAEVKPQILSTLTCKALQELLDQCDKALSTIDYKAKEIEVREGDLERLDLNRVQETVYLGIKNPVIKNSPVTSGHLLNP